MIEIGGGEAGIPGRGKAPGAVIEAFAGDVDIVGVEHAVDEAGGHILRRHARRAFDGMINQRGDRCGAGGVRRKVAEAVIDQFCQSLAVLVEGLALEAAIAHVAVIEAHQHGGAGGRGFIAADQLLTRFDHAERAAGGDTERFQHFGGKDLAHRAFEGQAAIAHPAPRRGTAALGAKVHQPALIIAALREQEAAAVAKIGVVGTELVAVITQRQRSGQAAGQGDEAAEMLQPRIVTQPGQPHLFGGAVVAEAQDGLGKRRGFDRIEKLCAQFEDGGFRGEFGHGANLWPQPAPQSSGYPLAARM